jgi:hypothetical protein
MGKRIYTVPFTATVTNSGGNADLWEITPGDDHPVLIRGMRLGQTSEVGDAAEENLRLSVIRMTATVTSGSGGSAGVPVQVDLAAQTPTFTSETNNATVATTSGATEIIEELGWNERATPLEVWYPDPDFAPKAIQGQVLLVRMQSTPADDFTFAGTVWIEEQ